METKLLAFVEARNVYLWGRWSSLLNLIKYAPDLWPLLTQGKTPDQAKEQVIDWLSMFSFYPALKKVKSSSALQWLDTTMQARVSIFNSISTSCFPSVTECKFWEKIHDLNWLHSCMFENFQIWILIQFKVTQFTMCKLGLNVLSLGPDRDTPHFQQAATASEFSLLLCWLSGSGQGSEVC